MTHAVVSAMKLLAQTPARRADPCNRDFGAQASTKLRASSRVGGHTAINSKPQVQNQGGDMTPTDACIIKGASGILGHEHFGTMKDQYELRQPHVLLANTATSPPLPPWPCRKHLVHATLSKCRFWALSPTP